MQKHHTTNSCVWRHFSLRRLPMVEPNGLPARCFVRILVRVERRRHSKKRFPLIPRGY